MNGLIRYAWKEKGIASHDQPTSEERPIIIYIQ